MQKLLHLVEFICCQRLVFKALDPGADGIVAAQRADIDDRPTLGDGFGIRIDVAPAFAQAGLGQYFPNKIGFFAKSGIAAIADDFAGNALGDFAVRIRRYKDAAVGMAMEVNESDRKSVV